MNNIFHCWHPVKLLEDDILQEFDKWSLIQKDWLEKSKQWKVENERKFAKIQKSIMVRSFIYSGQIENLYRLSKDPEENRGQTESIIHMMVEGGRIEHKIENLSREQQTGLRNFNETSKRLAEHMKDYFQKDLDSYFIKGLHTLSMEGINHYGGRDNSGNIVNVLLEKGVWKKSPNSVTRSDGKKHEYCPPEQVQSEIEKLLALTNFYLEKAEREELNPIVVAGFLHHRFVQIHPFPDGNGRVARLLMNFILIKFELLPIIIDPDEKDDYYRLLEIADGGDLIKFIQFLRKSENIRIQNFYKSWKSSDYFEDDGLVKYAEDIGDFLKEAKEKKQKDIEDILLEKLDMVLKISEEFFEKQLGVFAKKMNLYKQKTKKNALPEKAHYFWKDIIDFVNTLNLSNQYFASKSENNCSNVFSLKHTKQDKTKLIFELIFSFHKVGQTNQISVLPFLQIKEYPFQTNIEEKIIPQIEKPKYYLKKPFFISADDTELELKESTEELSREVLEKFILDTGEFLKNNY